MLKLKRAVLLQEEREMNAKLLEQNVTYTNMLVYPNDCGKKEMLIWVSCEIENKFRV